jgi:hypothetical protein
MTDPTDPVKPEPESITIQATVVVTGEPIADDKLSIADQVNAANATIEADRRTRASARAEAEADRSLAYILVSLAVHRAQHFADELQITKEAWYKISTTQAPGPERDINLAWLEVRKEVAEANLPDALNLQAVRLKLLAAIEAGDAADQPTTAELWTQATALGGMPSMPSMAYLWTKYVGAKDAKTEAPVEPAPADPAP